MRGSAAAGSAYDPAGCQGPIAAKPGRVEQHCGKWRIAKIRPWHDCSRAVACDREQSCGAGCKIRRGYQLVHKYLANAQIGSAQAGGEYSNEKSKHRCRHR